MSTFRQDMPPKGGYDPIEWAKKAARQRMSGAKCFSLFGIITVAAWTNYFIHNAKRKKNELEMNDGRLALEPLLNAERERHLLRQLRKNRDDENEIMKDVPGWETGTFFGTPVYYNQVGRWPKLTPQDIYMHNEIKHMHRRMFEKHYH